MVMVVHSRSLMVVLDSHSLNSLMVVVDAYNLRLVIVKQAVADKVASLLGIATPAAVALVPASVMAVASGGVAEAEELVGQSCVSAVAELDT